MEASELVGVLEASELAVVPVEASELVGSVVVDLVVHTEALEFVGPVVEDLVVPVEALEFVGPVVEDLVVPWRPPWSWHPWRPWAWH